MDKNTYRLTVFLGCGLFVFIFIAVIGAIIVAPAIASLQKPTSIPLIFPTRDPIQPTEAPPATSQIPSSSDKATGKIVYVCQIYKATASDQICIINADGTGQRRLTTNDSARHYYPSIAPDGQSIIFSSNMDGNFELYEMDLAGTLKRFQQPGIAPEISPDNRLIAFVQNDGTNDAIWVMNRDGSNPHKIYAPGWDPTWSPDGTRILFASYPKKDITQLMSINLDGSDLRQITDLPYLRGRSDWSSDNQHITTYSGQPWERNIFIMDPDGNNARQVTPPDGNSQGPSFSPDGKWLTFTAYYGKLHKIHGCEIYIIKLDGTQLTPLTNNDYCDWQPRWGP